MDTAVYSCIQRVPFLALKTMIKSNTNKYILYIRKSTDDKEKQVLSLDSQKEEMLKIAKRENIEIVETIEESRSAKLPKNRPLFAKMLADISSDKANAIICWRLDRLSRNPIDSAEISWMLQQGVLQHIKTHEREYYPKDNVVVMSVDTAMANQYIRDLSENVTLGLKRKAQMGWYPSRAPLGYLNDRSEIQGQRKILKDPLSFDLVRRMFDYMLTGAYSSLAIWRIFSKELNLKTVKSGKFTKSYIYQIFCNPFYYGDFEYPKKSGNWYMGKHEPIITKDEFDHIQVLLGLRTAPKPKGRFFPFTTLIRCQNCKARITAEYKEKRQKNGNVHKYVYYHCTKRLDANCTQKSLGELELDKQLASDIEKITIPSEFHEWAMAQLKIAHHKEISDRNIVIDSLQREYNKQVAFIDSLIEMRANKELTEEEFIAKKSVAMQNKLRLQAGLNGADKRVDDWVSKTEKLLGFTFDAIERFKNGTPQVKREMLAYLGSNHSLFNQKLTLDLEKPLLYIEEASQEVEAINKRLEPLNNGINKELLWDEYAKNDVLCPREESNLYRKIRNLASYPLNDEGFALCLVGVRLGFL